MNSDQPSTIATKTHVLEDDGIKISLPTEFERYSLYDYQRMVDSVSTKDQYNAEVLRIEKLMEMDGNLYMYFDPINRASYTINTMEYYAFTREDASFMLGNLSESFKKNNQSKNITVEKVTGKYYASEGRRTFKAIYKMENKKDKSTWYSTVYFVSEIDKTVYVQLSTSFMINFDPIVAKMVFR